MRGWYVIDDLPQACGEFETIPLAVEIRDVSVPDVASRVWRRDHARGGFKHHKQVSNISAKSVAHAGN